MSSVVEQVPGSCYGGARGLVSSDFSVQCALNLKASSVVPMLVSKLAESVLSVCSNASVDFSQEHSSEISPTEDCLSASGKSLIFNPPSCSLVFKPGSTLPVPSKAPALP